MFLRWTPLTAEQSRKTRNHVVEGGKVKSICNLTQTNMWKTSGLRLRRNLDQIKFFKMIYWVAPNQCIFGSLCQKIGPISPLEQVFEEVRSNMAEMDVNNTLFLLYFKFWSVYLALLDCETSIWRFPPGPKFEDEGRWMEGGPLPRSLPSVISPSWGEPKSEKAKVHSPSTRSC